jgi:hypothetical protein
MGEGTGRARVRRSTPAEISAAPAAPPAPDLEARQEADAEELDGAVLVPLESDDGVVELLVPPAEEWRDSALEALNNGRFGLWASKTLGPEDYAAWVAADPRVRQAQAFFEEYGRLSGASLGKLRQPADYLRSTRSR